MTEQHQTGTSFKRLLLGFILTTLALMIAWVSYFLFTLDLNNYRQEMEDQLASLLSSPVHIGTLHYNFHETNLALHVANLEIGNENSLLQVNAPDIMINLQWRGLFERDFRFSKISVTQPQVWVRPWIERQSAIGDQPQETIYEELESDLLESISIDRLEIIAGSVGIKPPPDLPGQTIDLGKINGELSVQSLTRTVRFALQGELIIPEHQGESPWQLQGRSSLELRRDRGVVPQINLELSLQKLDLGAVRSYFSDYLTDFSIKGSGDLQLHLEETPDGRTEFQAELSSKQIELSPSPAYGRPIILRKILLGGQLQMHGEQPGIENVSVEIDSSRLAGRIGWSADGQPFATRVTLLDSRMTIAQLTPWLPDNTETWRSLRRGLGNQGAVAVKQVDFTLSESEESQLEWRLDSFSGELEQVTWDLETAPAMELISLPLNYAKRLWQLKHGRIQWGSLPLTLNGAGKYHEGKIVLASLDFGGKADPEALLKEWQVPQHSLLTKGSIDFSGHLEGPLDQLNLDLQADLSQFHLVHPSGWSIAPGADDNLSLHATLSPQKISLDHGAMTWSVVKGHISGAVSPEDLGHWTADAFLQANDLGRLAEVVPFLEELQLHGQADISFRQDGSLENTSAGGDTDFTRRRFTPHQLHRRPESNKRPCPSHHHRPDR